MECQFSACIGMYHVVDTLMWNTYALLLQYTRYLSWWPLFFYDECLILHTNSGARTALWTKRLRRCIALSLALHQMYLPDWVLLSFKSRKCVNRLYTLLARYTNITKVVPTNFFVYPNECKIKVSRACVHARTQQNSVFCFHNLHTYRCKTLENKEIEIVYLHSFRKMSEKSRKSRKMGWKKRYRDNWEEVWMRGRKWDKSECCPQLSEIFEKTWEITQKTWEILEKTLEILRG